MGSQPSAEDRPDDDNYDYNDQNCPGDDHEDRYRTDDDNAEDSAEDRPDDDHDDYDDDDDNDDRDDNDDHDV